MFGSLFSCVHTLRRHTDPLTEAIISATLFFLSKRNRVPFLCGSSFVVIIIKVYFCGGIIINLMSSESKKRLADGDLKPATATAPVMVANGVENLAGNGSTTTTLALLPKEVLESILTSFCDGYSLHQFWLAGVAARQQVWNSTDRDNGSQDGSVQEVFKTMLKRVSKIRLGTIEKKTASLQMPGNPGEIVHTGNWVQADKFNGMVDFSTDEVSEEWDFQSDSIQKCCGWSLRFSHLFFAVDFSEKIPINFVWAGKLQFQESEKTM